MIFHQQHNSLANYNYNAVFYTDEVWDFHFHRNFELIYVLKGAVSCTVNNVSYRLCAGEFGLCLSYDIHRYRPEPDTRYWVLVFSEDYIRYFAKQLQGKTGLGFNFHCKAPVKDYLIQQLINNEKPSTLTLKSCLYAICEEYINNIKLADKDKRESEIISAIADYILENHTKRLSLSDIAERLGYDYNYTSRCFHSIFNMSFTDFVNIHRLETATRLLEETDKSITSVAYESGFQSIRTFNSFFKGNTGISPSAYRRQTKK